MIVTMVGSEASENVRLESLSDPVLAEEAEQFVLAER